MRAVQMQPGQERRLPHHCLWVRFVFDKQQRRNSRKVSSAIVLEEGKPEMHELRQTGTTGLFSVSRAPPWLTPTFPACQSDPTSVPNCLTYQSNLQSS